MCNEGGCVKIVSGGQTGADQAALDAAIAAGIPHGGWIAKGRKTERGQLPMQYQLQEMESRRYRVRTEQNVLDSDGTLICSFGPLTGGSALTEALAIRHDKPCLHINFEHSDQAQAIPLITGWMREHAITILNVAGPRASSDPAIYKAVYTTIEALLRKPPQAVHQENR